MDFNQKMVYNITYLKMKIKLALIFIEDKLTKPFGSYTQYTALRMQSYTNEVCIKQKVEYRIFSFRYAVSALRKQGKTAYGCLRKKK